MEEFKNILKDKLSAAYPNGEFIHIINSAKRYLVVDNCGIFITGMCYFCIYSLTLFNTNVLYSSP